MAHGYPPRVPRPRPGDEIEVTVDDLAFGGAGVARHDGLVVFVPHTAPGDRVRARVRKSRRRHADAQLTELLEAGPERIATVGQWQRERGDISGYEYTKLLDGLDTSFLTFDYLKESGACVTGDPESCIATARRFEKAGCDLLLCLVQPWKIPHEKVMKSIELLGKYVIPEFEK